MFSILPSYGSNSHPGFAVPIDFVKCQDNQAEEEINLSSLIRV